MYAVGSDRQAAFRSGVPVQRTKVARYALAGLFAAMGGLVAHDDHRATATPLQGPYLLASVAAAVLGGVSLAGGRGGLVGPIIAVFILRLARQDLTLMSVDPNVAQIVEGLIMVGGRPARRRRGAPEPSGMTRRGRGRDDPLARPRRSPGCARSCATARSSRSIGLLVLLIVALEVIRPGIVNELLALEHS